MMNGAWGYFLTGYYGIPQPQLMMYSSKLGSWEDVATLLLLSRLSGTKPDIIIGWRLGGQPWFGIVQRLNLSPGVLFVPVPQTVVLAPPYGNAYGYWRKGRVVYVTDPEVRNLALLRSTVTYYDLPPGFVMSQVERGVPFGQIIVAEERGRIPKSEVGHPGKGGPPPWAGKGKHKGHKD